MRKPKPSTMFVLKGFIPYTQANFALSFQPSLFFKELEKISRIQERTLRSAYYRAVSKGLIEIGDDSIPRLSVKGLAKIKRYKPKKLGKDAVLMVVFDIPEDERGKRHHLRALLKELSFKKIQQSVWATEFDHREYLTAEIKEYGLEKYVLVYEASKIKLKL